MVRKESTGLWSKLTPQKIYRELRALIVNFSWNIQVILYERLRPWYAGKKITVSEEGASTRRFGKGSAGYALNPQPLNSESIVYSFGVGCDIDFDLALIEAFGLEVHAFDPTRQSRQFIESFKGLPSKFRFSQYALGLEDGKARFQELMQSSNPHYYPGTLLEVGRGKKQTTEVPVLSLKSIVSEKGHKHIDVLKLDIEGGELMILEALISPPVPVGQIVLELHPHLYNMNHHGTLLGNYGWDKAAHFLDSLCRAGFKVRWISERKTEFCLERS